MLLLLNTVLAARVVTSTFVEVTAHREIVARAAVSHTMSVQIDTVYLRSPTALVVTLFIKTLHRRLPAECFGN